MILQCDQCNTKFRLDDSKLKPGGVKVRCSKCRHVFVAGAEQKPEESDFDALLSGLGAPAPAKAEVTAQTAQEVSAGAEAANPAAEPTGFDFGDVNIETGTAAGKEDVASGASEEAFGDVDFNEKQGASQQKAPAASELDFGEFSFDETPAASKEEAAPAAAPEVDFGDFSFEETPAGAKEEAAPASGSELDFGELSFDEPPAASKEEAAPAAAAEVDFGEFSFDETPAAPKEEAAPTGASELDFGDFSFDEPAAAPKEEAAPTGASELDFGDFSFDEPPAAPKEEVAPASGPEVDFGEFSFDEAPAAPKEETTPAAAEASMDFGEFSFEETPSAAEEKTSPAAGAALDMGDFSLEEPAAAAKEEPAGESFDFGDFSFEEQPTAVNEEPGKAPAAASFSFEEASAPQEQPAAAEPVKGKTPASEKDEFSFGEFSFGEEMEAGPEEAPVPAATAAAGGAVKPDETAPLPAAKPAAKSSLDFTFGDKPFAASVPEMGDEEELPPLSISSRRKGRSALTVAVVAVCAVVVLALSGAGLYLLQSGPEAMKRLDKLGIGFVAKWFGMQVPEEGRITVRNALASFHQNKEAGELFVVNGEAVNSYRKTRASIQVKVSVFDKAGKVLMQKTAYCGNRLSDEQLSDLPVAKIDSIMNNQFGDSLSNLGVKPDQSIGFVVAIANVPKEAADFGVEVVGSTVAAGQ